MKTKFTPGPWKIGNGSFIITKHKTKNIQGDINSSLNYYDGYLICESVHENNANLIVNAPELYNILQEALDEELAYEAGERVYGKWVEKAKQILTKARGELI
jgi:hypothetical protein